MKVSIIIPLYNKENYISATIRSVLAQTFHDFEIVIVNDGSTDNSASVVLGLNDDRIRLIEQANSGVSVARNVGINASRGEWIAFLDADDLWLPHNLESHFKLLEKNPFLQWSAGHYNRTLKSVSKPVRLNNNILFYQYSKGVIHDALALLPYGFLWTGTVIIRKKVFAEIGYMDSTLQTCEDLDMWLRIALAYPSIAYCQEPIADYLVGDTNSLSHQKVANPTSLPHFQFARKHLASLSSILPERQSMVCDLVRAMVQNGICRLLITGYCQEAMQVTEEFRQILGVDSYAKHRLLAQLPVKVLRAGFFVKQAFKKC